jgi:OOP family OmpA-OmpF porin
MSQQIKPGAKKLLTLIGIVGCLSLVWWGLQKSGLIAKAFKTSVEAAKVDLPTAPINALTAGLKPAPMPGTTVSSKPNPRVNFEQMEWNSMLGAHFANGGPETTEGSIAEKNKLHIKFIRQDMSSESMKHIVKMAEHLKNGESIDADIHFFEMMGDGFPAVVAAGNALLKKIDPSYKLEVYFAAGKSSGEDGFWGPLEWRKDPSKARGGLGAMVKLDGDFNIAYEWCHDNRVAFNPDETTYDPDAYNFVNVDDYHKAGDLYIASAPIKRRLIKNGKLVGRDTIVKVDSYASWTPVDENVSRLKGGVVRLISTKEYSNQMFGVVIGLNKYAEAHPEVVESLISTFTEGGDQVKSYSSALNKAGEISAQIYNDQNGPYWVKYAKGVKMQDKQGLNVDIGGSTQFNLGDNVLAFGLNEGGTNIYATVYANFADNVNMKLYPELYKEDAIPAAADAINLTYLRSVVDKAKSSGGVISSGEATTYSSGSSISQVYGDASYTIEFEPGSDVLKAQGKAVLNEVNGSLTNAGSLKVNINGYTDNTGSDAVNIPLSERRAQAIKSYLQRKYGTTLYPDSRVYAAGFGSQNPIASNATPVGRAKNRRVQIVIGD